MTDDEFISAVKVSFITSVFAAFTTLLIMKSCEEQKINKAVCEAKEGRYLDGVCYKKNSLEKVE